MKIRRFIGKRRRRVARRLQDMMNGRHVPSIDRAEVERFSRYLRGEMSADEARAYEQGA